MPFQVRPSHLRPFATHPPDSTPAFATSQRQPGDNIDDLLAAALHPTNGDGDAPPDSHPDDGGHIPKIKLRLGKPPSSTSSSVLTTTSSPLKSHAYPMDLDDQSESDDDMTGGTRTPTVVTPLPAPVVPTRTAGRPAANGPNRKMFNCPKAGCSKSYKQMNGLKYHLDVGQCNFAPPPPAGAKATRTRGGGATSYAAPAAGGVAGSGGNGMSEEEVKQLRSIVSGQLVVVPLFSSLSRLRLGPKNKADS